MTRLRVSPDLSLPEDVVTSTLVVYGGKGMGKTNFGSVLVEELSRAKLRWSFLDPMGVAWGLRHSADGQGPGVECVILGGPHGDMPIEPTGGAVVADFAVDEDVNVLIDISRKPSGDMWSNGERVRFVTDYMRRLFSRQGQLVNGRRREPLFQIVDEAARYMPQVIPSGRSDAFSLADCLGAFEQAVEEGRNIGLGVGLLTQRSARINKSVAELADAMIAFRTVGPNSIEAVTDWLGSHVEKGRIKELTGQVRALPIGSALVVSPGWLGVEKVVPFRARTTFDSSATPKAGERAKKVSGPGAKPDLAKYQQRMAETIERAKADDPKELRKRIAELEREKKQTEKQHAVAAPRIVEKTVIDREEVQRLAMKAFGTMAAAKTKEDAGAIRAGRAAVTQLERALGVFTATLEGTVVPGLRLMLTALEAPVPMPTNGNGGAHKPPTPIDGNPLTRIVKPIPTIPARRPDIAPRTAEAPGGPISKSNQRIIDALAFYESTGVETPTRGMLATFCGKTEGGSWSARLSEARSAGLITDVEPGRVRLTDEGRAAADTTTIPRSLDELHRRWLDKMPGTKQREALRILLDIYPESISRAELAERVGAVEGGSWSARLSEMRAPGVLEDVPDQKGHVRASAALFPAGLD